MKSALLIAALYCVSPAFAQKPVLMPDEPGAESFSQDDTKPTQPPRVPTTLTPISQSMATLLSDGWTISAANGVWAWTLYKGRKWAFCTIDNGRMSGRAPSSECMRLN
jgi:hypothetical protein